MIAEFHNNPDLLPLEGVVQHYDWGGFDTIPSLLQQPNPDRKPCAELWLGDHPSAPARALYQQTQFSLDQLIQAAPELILGPQTVAAFGRRLPYLFKVLDARQMLSIQAHPNLAQAREGYARENQAGIPLSSPQRNYKDDNHKPEVHVALTEFWMLHGFRPIDQILSVFDGVPELRGLMSDLRNQPSGASGGKPTGSALTQELYQKIMTMPEPQANQVLQPLLQRLIQQSPADKSTPEFWLHRAATQYARPDNKLDRGLFSFYLLNLVHLKPGQATYQPAGMLHAYLEGVNVELMANSDNVLRGGLTSKHVDVRELLRILSFDGAAPSVMNGEPCDSLETVYRTPAAEFELSCLNLKPGQTCRTGPNRGPHILLALQGDTRIQGHHTEFRFHRGNAMLAPHVTGYTIGPSETTTLIFRASMPAQN
jgi:mannose-6-phosphate isomerase